MIGRAEGCRAAIAVWRELLQREEYFEAHEAVEVYWLRAEGGEAALMKGLIQLAAALHHASRGNRHGMRVKLVSGGEYVSRAADLGIPDALQILHADLPQAAVEAGRRLALCSSPGLTAQPEQTFDSAPDKAEHW